MLRVRAEPLTVADSSKIEGLVSPNGERLGPRARFSTEISIDSYRVMPAALRTLRASCTGARDELKVHAVIER